ncbi:2-C-methyl-D-erythritol 4-phosphate cytidylyltransferase [Demequina sp. NBRC 110053]|uniref:2-C-methyl-D-erythritol 4-phosphate cytidylyltransferase n=1 Tax=Demequina sp. NBRC 110053 TaxID=1570342 RepID=UPI000A0111E8|nr:2-C-methyl-D-erythritol 4-phosphate cytidylyltransferase [Demequina sp. NBRC 110053]
MTTAAVVTAAGSGTRLGADVPKALVHIEGRALVAWAVSRVLQIADAVVVTAPASHLDAFREAVDGAARVVAGGATRQESVAAGLTALALDDDDVVLIHDAARAFQDLSVMAATVRAVEAGADGAVPVVPVTDTLVAAPAADGGLGAPLDRATLRAVQTPQTFRGRVALDAHRSTGVDATDDASLARELGYRIVAVDGHEWGFKVTRPSDLILAAAIAPQVEAS